MESQSTLTLSTRGTDWLLVTMDMNLGKEQRLLISLLQPKTIRDRSASQVQAELFAAVRKLLEGIESQSGTP